MEAEVKSEATGGRVSVETKDQKVWLHLFPVLAPLPAPPPPTPPPRGAAPGQRALYERGSGRLQG